MQDTLTHHNATDFKSRYAGTFGWYVDSATKDKTLVYVSGVSSKAVSFKDEFQRELSAVADAGVMFEFIPVNRQWRVRDDHSLFFTQRVPARMWKRGIASDNTSIQTFLAGDLQAVPVYFGSIFSLLRPQKNSVIPFKLPTDWSRGCFLSKHFVISPLRQVYFFDKVVGALVDTTIILSDDLILQELQDLIKRNNLPLTVKVG
jgi:hypothetical protein